MSDFAAQLEKIGEYGVIEEVHIPIIIAAGLPGASLHEIVLFETGQMGTVFVLERDRVQILIFSTQNIKVGTRVTRTGKFLSVPIGENLLGKAIDPLGYTFSESRPVDRPKEEREIDTEPLGMPYRVRIKKPFYTGVSIIDMMLPLGKGQKELVIGDRKTGKTTFLLQAIKNQAKEGTFVVYGAIGKKKSDIKKIMEYLEREGLTKQSIVVATSSYDAPSLIYQTPYSAVTVGEYFRDQGRDVLVVLDDLSVHAKFYREISLLAKRFPGRESYPGDIFYTHARLLERAGNYMINNKEVSVTILPVAELVEGDFTGYIATNLMGMTDGHLYFDSNIYYNGRRPAVNTALSVTRVGRQTQTSLQRSITREITAFLALYEKMQNLSHFGAELTDTVKQILLTGTTVYDFFEQPASQVIPNKIQLILFSMIWLKFFNNPTKININVYRLKLIDAMKDTGTNQLFEELIATDNFNQLLSNVSQKKAVLLSICGANSVPGTSAPHVPAAASQSSQGQYTEVSTSASSQAPVQPESKQPVVPAPPIPTPPEDKMQT